MEARHPSHGLEVNNIPVERKIARDTSLDLSMASPAQMAEMLGKFKIDTFKPNDLISTKWTFESSTESGRSFVGELKNEFGYTKEIKITVANRDREDGSLNTQDPEVVTKIEIMN